MKLLFIVHIFHIRQKRSNRLTAGKNCLAFENQRYEANTTISVAALNNLCF